MRPKSLQKFKDKVRELTPRKHNFDAQVIVKLNRVIRGTALYFATPFSTVSGHFREVDKWIRMRVRSMKFKRKCPRDNRRFRVKKFERLGLLTLVSFVYKYRA